MLILFTTRYRTSLASGLVGFSPPCILDFILKGKLLTPRAKALHRSMVSLHISCMWPVLSDIYHMIVYIDLSKDPTIPPEWSKFLWDSWNSVLPTPGKVLFLSFSGTKLYQGVHEQFKRLWKRLTDLLQNILSLSGLTIWIIWRKIGKKWKRQYRNSEYYICSTFGVGVGRMVLIDSQVCFYHKQISILTLLTCIRFLIHRKIWSEASFFVFLLVNILHSYCRWCLQEFLSLRFLLLDIISLPTWKCEQAYIFPISWLFWQFSLKGRKSPIKFLWASKAETSAGAMSSLLALLLSPSLELIISLFHQCPCTQWGTQREVSGKTHYK